jgi:hypothetical protein
MRVRAANRPALLDLFPILYEGSRSITERMGEEMVGAARELENGAPYKPQDLDKLDEEARAHLYTDLMPVLERMKRSWVWDRAGWRVAAVSFAALEYRLTHARQWPNALTETGLDPELLKDPRDPEQRQLKFLIDRGLVVWSDKFSDDRWIDIVFRTPPFNVNQ